MPVSSYELDQEVFRLLKEGRAQLDNWQGAASEIADYVASWGVERFWAMSRSPVLRGGAIPEAGQGSEEQRRYFPWAVARVVLCSIVRDDLGIKDTMTTEEFQNRFRQLNFNQQVLLTDLLIEISLAIQFWTMGMKDVKDSGNSV
jgi:hypothetical protein